MPRLRLKKIQTRRLPSLTPPCPAPSLKSRLQRAKSKSEAGQTDPRKLQSARQPPGGAPAILARARGSSCRFSTKHSAPGWAWG